MTPLKNLLKTAKSRGIKVFRDENNSRLYLTPITDGPIHQAVSDIGQNGCSVKDIVIVAGKTDGC